MKKELDIKIKLSSYKLIELTRNYIYFIITNMAIKYYELYLILSVITTLIVVQQHINIVFWDGKTFDVSVNPMFKTMSKVLTLSLVS